MRPDLACLLRGPGCGHRPAPGSVRGPALGLLPGALLLHGDAEGEGKLGVVIRVHSELESSSSRGSSHAILALIAYYYIVFKV